ncbi:MAG: hypothetical protein ACTHM0_00905 [Sphingomonas sp.]
MRILETNEVGQVSGAGLLGLNLNLGVLDILGIHAGVSVGGNDRGRSNDHGRNDCHGRSRRDRCY